MLFSRRSCFWARGASFRRCTTPTTPPTRTTTPRTCATWGGYGAISRGRRRSCGLRPSPSRASRPSRASSQKTRFSAPRSRSPRPSRSGTYTGRWALRLLKPEALLPARLAPPETGLGRLLWKKWYVDELYDAIIVRPLQWLAREVLWKSIDARLVDGLIVNGSATASRALGWLGSRLQTGEVGFYVVLFVVGVLLLVGGAVR